MVRYRLNALASVGTGYVDGSHLERRLGSLAVDLHLNRSTVVELTASNYRLDQKGCPGWFTYGQNIVLPAAPDSSRLRPGLCWG
jgi:iron complex outermembrane receptor protein